MTIPEIYKHNIEANDRVDEIDTNLDGIVKDWIEQQQELYKQSNRAAVKEAIKFQMDMKNHINEKTQVFHDDSYFYVSKNEKLHFWKTENTKVFVRIAGTDIIKRIGSATDKGEFVSVVKDHLTTTEVI